jgi:hypothetical protein
MRKNTIIFHVILMQLKQLFNRWIFILLNMWKIHYRFGKLASEWPWLCSSCLGDEMVLYMHIQGVHALRVTEACHPHTLGHLRNVVMECKHKDMKKLNTNQRSQ